MVSPGGGGGTDVEKKKEDNILGKLEGRHEFEKAMGHRCSKARGKILHNLERLVFRRQGRQGIVCKAACLTHQKVKVQRLFSKKRGCRRVCRKGRDTFGGTRKETKFFVLEEGYPAVTQPILHPKANATKKRWGFKS